MVANDGYAEVGMQPVLSMGYSVMMAADVRAQGRRTARIIFVAFELLHIYIDTNINLDYILIEQVDSTDIPFSSIPV